jgi:hypothetical protein
LLIFWDWDRKWHKREKSGWQHYPNHTVLY